MAPTKTSIASQRMPATFHLRRFREPLLNIIVVLLVCLGLLQCCLIFTAIHGRATQADFSTYYLTAKEISVHSNPYTADFLPSIEHQGYNTGGVTHATDPPTFVMLIAPLARVSINRAFWLWSALNAICLAVSAYLLFGAGSGLAARTRWMLIAIVVWYPAVAGNLFFAQSKLQTLLFLTLMLSLMKAGRDGTAGIAFGLAILLRVFPLAILGYVLLYRRWRLLVFTATTCASGTLITILVLGIADTRSFTHGIATLTDQRWASMAQDLSINGFISRVFWTFSPPGQSGLIDILRPAVVACVSFVILWMTVRATLAFVEIQDRDWRLFSLWVVTSVFLSPISWLHYEVIFLILFAELAAAVGHSRVSRRAIAMGLANWLFALLWAGGVDEYAIHARTWWQHIVAEFGFFSMLSAYLSAYWLAIDQPGAISIATRAIPIAIWRRVTNTDMPGACRILMPPHSSSTAVPSTGC